MRWLYLILAAAALALPTASRADFMDGLVLYYPLDEGAGETATDHSGMDHHGVISSPQWTDGKHNGALLFGGANSGTFITTESSDALNVNEMTFMAWVNANTWDGTRQIVGKSVHGGCSGRTQYGIFSENGILRARFETAGGRVNVDVEDLPPTAQWVHVALTNDGANAALYIDGAEAGTAPIPGALNANADPWRLAQDCDRAGNIFDGSIDEARLWNRALPMDEIQTYMDWGLAQTVSVDPAGKMSAVWARLKNR